jgi:DNA excision repair protein ERCC-5
VQRIAGRGMVSCVSPFSGLTDPPQVGAVNKQATLDPFFDLSIGQGNYAPRRRTTANVSKRLMGVIKQYREAEARVTGQQPEGWGTMMVDLDEEDPKGRGTGKRRKSKTLEEEGGDTEEDSESVPKRRKSESRAKLKRAASSATISEMGTESVGSSVGAGEDVNQRGRRKRTASVGRGRGRGRGRAPSRTQSGEVVVE